MGFSNAFLKKCICIQYAIGSNQTKSFKSTWKTNKITYARTRRSQLTRLYRLVEKFPLFKKLDSGFKPSEILNKLSVIEAVCETTPKLWADGATLVDNSSDKESSTTEDDEQ